MSHEVYANLSPIAYLLSNEQDSESVLAESERFESNK